MKPAYLNLILVMVIGLTLSACQKQEVTGRISDQVAKEQDLYGDWVVFEKENHKFSFKHPREWLFVPEIDKEGLFTGRMDREDPAQEDFINEITGEPFTVVYSISMRVEDNSENLSAREYELSKYIPEGRADIEANLSDITIGGAEGVKIATEAVQVNTSGPPVEYLLAPDNGKVYRFVYVASAHEQTDNKFLEEFNRILSTLKFSR